MNPTKDARIRFWSKAGGLIGGGVPWVDAFILASASVTDAPGFRVALDRVVERMRAGDAPSDAMADETAFSDEVVRMVRAGEEMGDLEAKCEHIAAQLRTGAFAMGDESTEPAEPDPDLEARCEAARARGASHLHLEPGPDDAGSLRLRIEGKLTAAEPLEPETYRTLVDAVRRGATGTAEGHHAVYREGPGAVLRLSPSAGVVALRDEDRERIRRLVGDGGGVVLVASRSASTLADVADAALASAAKVCVLSDDAFECPDALHLGDGPEARRAAEAQDPDALVLTRIESRDAARLATRSARGGRLVVAAMDVDHAAAALAGFAAASGDPLAALDAAIGVLAPTEHSPGALDIIPVTDDLRRELAADPSWSNVRRAIEEFAAPRDA